MSKIHTLAALTALAAFSAGAAAEAAPQAPAARISMARARTIALRAAPGRVISAELEKENGGWRYSFDIRLHGNVQEIGVDAVSGRIVENKSEGKVDHD
ncbi:MAG: PepSY domain-containing protein [Alphaproteobacteria bacterium]|nr:PepSY domain-containing protein [Alphaproteobacteria bacterium]